MAVYEYDRIGRLAGNLIKAGVDQAIVDQIMAGGELIRKDAKPEKKADWLQGAMERMDTLLDRETRYAVRESCACCLGGKRLQVSKSIGKNNKDLADAIKAANDAKFVFGNSVTMQDDGRIMVSFFPEGMESYQCVCLRKAKGPVSVTYCYCCGGHVKHHLQNALGRKLSCEVQSSALESDGKSPCTFLFTIEGE